MIFDRLLTNSHGSIKCDVDIYLLHACANAGYIVRSDGLVRRVLVNFRHSAKGYKLTISSFFYSLRHRICRGRHDAYSNIANQICRKEPSGKEGVSYDDSLVTVFYLISVVFSLSFAMSHFPKRLCNLRRPFGLVNVSTAICPNRTIKEEGSC